jgi:hypothetical protein
MLEGAIRGHLRIAANGRPQSQGQLKKSPPPSSSRHVQAAASGDASRHEHDGQWPQLAGIGLQVPPATPAPMK